MTTRRSFLAAGGVLLAGLVVPRGMPPVEIRMRATERGEEVWFDPIGLYVHRGTTVRWIVEHDVHTTSAYHPTNDHHSLRIPEEAQPWDSGFLTRPEAHFDVTFTVDGVYDYYCMPHEAAGMVGRIIVGKPSGPGALPFDYFTARSSSSDWKPVPEAARQAFPSIDAIMTHKIVRRSRAHTISSHSNHTG